MINIEQFWERPDNMNLLNKWREDKGLIEIDGADLPEIGLMVFDNHKPIAAGFLRDAEGIGVIDSVVADPEASKEIRDEAVDTVFERLIQIAKMKDIKTVIGTTNLECMIKRANKFGFSKIDHVVMILPLGRRN